MCVVGGWGGRGDYGGHPVGILVKDISLLGLGNTDIEFSKTKQKSVCGPWGMWRILTSFSDPWW